jgi:hypothetical protein
MPTRIAPRGHSRPAFDFDSRYDRCWTALALVAALAWIAIAILQSPWVPLSGMTAGLGGVGGALFVRAPASRAEGMRQYAAGASVVAAAVLVIIGVGHHPMAGLTVVALLTASSPRLLRWIAGA